MGKEAKTHSGFESANFPEARGGVPSLVKASVIAVRIGKAPRSSIVRQLAGSPEWRCGGQFKATLVTHLHAYPHCVLAAGRVAYSLIKSSM